ncbi:hypothetical protein D3C83_219120 [compost metagenome]
MNEPLLAAVLRPLVYVGTALALATPLATWGVALSIAFGAGVGSLAGRVLAGSNGRLIAPPR